MDESYEPLTPQMLIYGYSRGLFPMARSRRGGIDWYSPDPRCVMPLERFHVPRSLAKKVRRGVFEVTVDRAFGQVIRACAQPRSYESETWINNQIIDAYERLAAMGLAGSIEAWSPPGSTDAELVGGLYGVTMGGAFFGESMFSRATDASKVCLVHLVERLRQRGFTLLDVQFPNPHLAQFGIEQIPRQAYLARLRDAMAADVQW